MKKKLIAILVALSLLVSVGVVAMASTSNGAIEFKEGTGGIIDPECCPCDPDDPDENCDCDCHDGGCCDCDGDEPDDDCDCDCHEIDKIKPQLGSMAIDFGLQEVSSSNEKYKSVEDARGLHLRAAGFLVESPGDWTVSLSITGFTHQGDRLPVLQGFELELIPGLFEENPGERQGTGAWKPGNTGVTTGPVPTKLNSGVVLTAGNPGVPVATGGAGFSGGNFAGELMVFVGTARVGEAKATLNWDYMTGTP